jgi:radical SAM superfamily enzyme YgiQ (UPF0313 family)
MNIALINPPFLFPVRDEIVYSHCLGLRYISSYIKTKSPHKIEFIDSLAEGFTNVKKYANGYIVGLEIDDIMSRIPYGTDIIGVSIPFSQLAPVAHDIVRDARSRFPDAKIVMGGVYPSTQPLLALTSEADMIVIGEGEEAFLQIAEGKGPGEIKGVWTNELTQQDLRLSPAEVIENLDSIPYADYAIPNIDRYFDLSPRMSKKQRTASIITSRGCPFSCEFCSIHPVYGSKWRGRSAENVLDEMEFLFRKYGVTSFEIEDDNFTLIKKRTVEILEGMIRLQEKGYAIGWRTPNGVRIETLDDSVIRLIKKSNCRHIVLGLEHGDREMLSIMDKKLDLDRAFEVIRGLVENRVPNISLLLIVGYPGETRERFLNGMEYLRRVRALGGNITVFVGTAQPYPGTRLLQQCVREGYVTDGNIDNFLVRRDLVSSGHYVTITTPDFDEKEVLSRKQKIIELFS